MRLRLTRQAEADLAQIADYLYSRNPQAAQDVEASLRAAFQLISAYPEVGRLRKPGVRRFAVPRYPYLIFYGIDGAAAEIQVFTVRHAARRDIA